MSALDQWFAFVNGVRSPIEYSERRFRLSTPSALELDGAVFRISDAQQTVGNFGAWPTRLSTLCLPVKPTGGVDINLGELARQIAAILTFASQRRVQVAEQDVEIRVGASQRSNFMSSSLADRSLSGPLPSSLRERTEFVISSIMGLERPNRLAVEEAMQLHYSSVVLCDRACPRGEVKAVELAGD